jgi:N-acetylneuraminate synthase
MSAVKNPRKITKDWGYELWLANNEEENYCGKILYIKPGMSTSLHFHGKKHETFYILEGELDVEVVCTATTVKTNHFLKEGDTFEIDRLVPHKLSATGIAVKFVEISTYHEDCDSYRVSR